MSNKVIKILRWLGSILAVIGIVGLIYTLGEIVCLQMKISQKTVVFRFIEVAKKLLLEKWGN